MSTSKCIYFCLMLYIHLCDALGHIISVAPWVHQVFWVLARDHLAKVILGEGLIKSQLVSRPSNTTIFEASESSATSALDVVDRDISWELELLPQVNLQLPVSSAVESRSTEEVLEAGHGHFCLTDALQMVSSMTLAMPMVVAPHPVLSSSS